MDDVACNTDDNTIQDCSFKDEFTENCGPHEGAGVECKNNDPSFAGRMLQIIRLTGLCFILGVLIAGGVTGLDSSTSLKSAELFNPDSGVTCSVGDMPFIAWHITACYGLICGGPNSKNVKIIKP